MITNRPHTTLWTIRHSTLYTMRGLILLPLVALVRALTPVDPIDIDRECRGYESGQYVYHSDAHVETNLTLRGKGCAVYGPDIPRLKMTISNERGRHQGPAISA